MLVDRNPLPDDLAADLRRQLAFVIEVDQMKAVIRETVIPSVDRCENDAEHSWHLALMAIVLREHAREPVDLPRVLEMLIVHDLVEVYAGDTPLRLQDDQQEVREREAADRLFPLLPGDQGDRLRGAWEEFEAHETAEAQFARSLDRLQPMLMEWMHDGQRWRDNGASAEGIRSRLGIIADGSPALWDVAESLIAEADRRGWLSPDEPGNSVGF
ncbi:MAG: HD domain-containing protein [Solirubrobacteraceae bacterium]|nr:HD domain-containing protein [Patulibacter sp.]